MNNFFKRHRARIRPVAEAIRITPEDRHIATHFGYTDEQWADLAPLYRVDKREEFAQVIGLGR